MPESLDPQLRPSIDQHPKGKEPRPQQGGPCGTPGSDSFFNRSKDGKLFTKDHESIFAMLMLSLPLDPEGQCDMASLEGPNPNMVPDDEPLNPALSQRKKKRKAASIFSKKTPPFSFTLEDAMAAIQHMSVKIVTGSTRTAISCAVPAHSARVFIQRFLSARLIHCPTDRTSTKCPPVATPVAPAFPLSTGSSASSSSSVSSASPAATSITAASRALDTLDTCARGFILQPTAKGVSCVERYCRKNGIALRPDAPIKHLFASAHNSMRTICFDRHPHSDEPMCNDAFIFLLFQRVMGPAPNVYAASNPPDRIPQIPSLDEDYSSFGPRGSYSVGGTTVFNSAHTTATGLQPDLSLYSPLDNSFSKPQIESPYFHRFFTNPDSDALSQYYVSTVGVRLFENKRFDVYTANSASSVLSSARASTSTLSFGTSSPHLQAGTSTTTVTHTTVDYCFTGRALWQWLLDCTDIVYQREAMQLANLFFSAGMIEPICAAGSRCLPDDTQIRIAKDAFYRLSETGREIAIWARAQREAESLRRDVTKFSMPPKRPQKPAGPTASSGNGPNVETSQVNRPGSIRSKRLGLSSISNVLTNSLRAVVSGRSTRDSAGTGAAEVVPAVTPASYVAAASAASQSSNPIEVGVFTPLNITFPCLPPSPPSTVPTITEEQPQRPEKSKDSGGKESLKEGEKGGQGEKEKFEEVVEEDENERPTIEYRKSLSFKRIDSKLAQFIAPKPSTASHRSVSSDVSTDNVRTAISSTGSSSSRPGSRCTTRSTGSFSSPQSPLFPYGQPQNLTLDDIINDAALLFLFREFLQQQLCEENLQFYTELTLFLLDFERLQRTLSQCASSDSEGDEDEDGGLPQPQSHTRSLEPGPGGHVLLLADTDSLYQMCLKRLYLMYHRYFAEQAPSELNIDWPLRRRLMSTMAAHIQSCSAGTRTVVVTSESPTASSSSLETVPTAVPSTRVGPEHSAFSYFSAKQSPDCNLRVLSEMAQHLQAAKAQVYRTMETDSLPRFLESRLYLRGMSSLTSFYPR